MKALPTPTADVMGNTLSKKYDFGYKLADHSQLKQFVYLTQ